MRKYNWGIIGTGYIAKKMADALPVLPNAKKYAVASRKQSTADEFARKNHFEKAYGSYEALVNDPAVDIVYVATPHNLHCSITIMAIEHGKHVLCEKPFAVNGLEVRKMIAKAKEKNVFLMEALWSRFLPNIIKAKEIIESGEIGKVKLLEIDFGIGRDVDPDSRLFNKKLIGGSLLDVGIYPVFMSLFLLGKPKTVKALAAIGSTGVDFNCSIAMGYEDEKMAVMHSSVIAQTDVVAKIYCEKGTLVFDKWWFCPVPIQIVNPDGTIRPIPLEFVGNGYNYEAEEVMRCIEQGKIQSDKMSWDDSLQLIDMLDLIRKEIGLVYEGHDDVA